ncbi:MAG: aminotransferase class V-fold PLP-dependent enzyme [Ignavibacteria bacterium]|nr:aminotransferase class V-fold PLP-dependent enzyme [Ignavibacteria bacterium]
MTRQRASLEGLRQEIVGIDTLVPVLDGTERPYIFLDNAASTPAFRRVVERVVEFLPWYSGVHRGTGFKSLISTEIFDRAHSAVARFVDADLSTNTVIFTKNTTECVNKLANRFRFSPDDIVVTTMMEHHSNDLPWRKHAHVIHIGVTEEGYADLQELSDTLKRHAGRVKLVAINGASNITGICAPIHTIAEWAHTAGAKIFVDAAQLAPHRAISMRGDDDPGHIDFLALSAHKLYAPFGTGALIGPMGFFEDGEPDAVGGGVVDIVTLDEVAWNHPPQKEEAGSPNVIGGIALAEALSVLQEVGLDAIEQHERELLEYAYSRLRSMESVALYGPTTDLRDKVGVITFNVDGMHHALVGAIMATEAGIGVRNGCFCAHPYVKHLLKVTPEEDHRLTQEVLSGNKANMPGMVRASLGCYSNRDDIDALVETLGRVAAGEYRGSYIQDRGSGAYQEKDFRPSFSKYFSFLEKLADTTGHRYSEAS